MKKLILIALLSFALLSCKKDDEPVPEKNQFVGTSWTAQDDIADFVYGGKCTTTIEFLTKTTCQRIDDRNYKYTHAATYVDEGTYTYKGDSVFWTIEDKTIKGKVSGSILTTDEASFSGTGLVYTKNN
jgi:hypothetical protein